MAQSQIFSRDPVWSQTTRSGFRQQIFVMYHSTKDPDDVGQILDQGFRISQNSPDKNLALGDGLYVSRDIEKTLGYGDVCFKLLVYPGKTVMVNELSDPVRTSWQSEYSSAWIPPNHDIPVRTGKGKEETCVKSSSQVRVLGIAYGHELLDNQTKARVRDVFGTGDKLDKYDNRVLDCMLENLGIIYSTFVHQGGEQLMLEGDRRDGTVCVSDWTGRDNQLWTRSWDNCLENKQTGTVLTAMDEGDLVLSPVEAAGVPSQKWRLDNKGRFLHKASNKYLCLDSDKDVCLKPFRQGGDRQIWKFRCLNQSRVTDTFIHFTPWQEMISWD